MRSARRASREHERGRERARVRIDNCLLLVEALDSDDCRSAHLRVAGVTALLIAKTHKIVDRIESGRRNRLDDKDAADVVRLMQTSSPALVASTAEALLDHPGAAASTRFAMDRFDPLFGGRAGLGIEMAARALREAMPESRVRAICLAFSEDLYSHLRA